MSVTTIEAQLLERPWTAPSIGWITANTTGLPRKKTLCSSMPWRAWEASDKKTERDVWSKVCRACQRQNGRHAHAKRVPAVEGAEDYTDWAFLKGRYFYHRRF